MEKAPGISDEDRVPGKSGGGVKGSCNIPCNGCWRCCGWRDRARARQGARLGSWRGRGEWRVCSSCPEEVCQHAVAGRREEISRGLAADESFRRIAARPGRSPSAVSREVGRYGGREGYRAARADQRARDNCPAEALCPAVPSCVTPSRAGSKRTGRDTADCRLACPDFRFLGRHVRVARDDRQKPVRSDRGVLNTELVSHLRRHRRCGVPTWEPGCTSPTAVGKNHHQRNTASSKYRNEPAANQTKPSLRRRLRHMHLQNHSCEGPMRSTTISARASRKGKARQARLAKEKRSRMPPKESQ
ncbi:helix-turn-helix domain-containing protein [Streptomyces sp. NPDC055085]